ncbi:D-isomer specific 2-hydroxyacid dehydrogenase [Astrocystis sublimbata]|nr:D-isomer specific 2-hydroxyacid dehydrogenase [Astrocystis sublimbata]
MATVNSVQAPEAPKQLPSPSHEVIVVLEEVHLPVSQVDTSPRTHEIISYRSISRPDEIRARVQCASILIATQAFITADSLGDAPYLKCVITPTSGTNHIDLDECKRRGIRVARCAGSTSPAVAEHALSLYFAARRRTVMLHNDIQTRDKNGDNAWTREGSVAYKMRMANEQPPCSVGEEVVGIIGHGHIGKRLEALCSGLGMEVLISERKSGAAPARDAIEPKTERTPFREVIGKATVLFICCISTVETQNMINAAEIRALRPETVIINVSRANVVNTREVIRALRERRISGAAVDVYELEPASKEEHSAYLAENTKDLNLTFSPHVGYFSTKTVVTMKSMVRERIRSFLDGNFEKFEV